MPATINELPQQVGDYTLLSLLGSQHDRSFYEAQQIHVGRIVIVELINAKTTNISREHFVESARVRVAEQIPGVMPVYEAVELDDYWLVCQERPKGKSLAELASANERLTPFAVCRLLEQVCELYHYCNAQRIRSNCLTANTVYQLSEEQFCFLSPARSLGEEEVSRSIKMAELAELIIPVLPNNNAEGQNRVYTLISWLQDGYDGQLLNWGTIGSTASLIIEQLHPELVKDLAETQDNEGLLQGRRHRGRQLPVCVGLLALLFGALLASIVQWIQPNKLDPNHYEELIINEKQLATMIHPISVLDYQRFLSRIERMSPSDLERLHKGIPEDSRKHKPTNWGEQMEQLHDKKTCTKPVHSVSYWDAIVYARLNRASIPTAAQLQFIKQETDKNDLAEWSRDTQDLPLYQKSYILINADGSIERESDPHNTSAKTSFRIIKTPKR
ncbi:MAG: SUMF1/EgtB/PvdO family nonheme iron enzyme [Akkermansia sp.]